ncbi:hypothetical protein H6G81_05645 [Scytonema hofmannii FACHB-248]|uniref:Uncharacterized protein n=2 Tax=Nostocales TaxID=1161 RepID=A0ABR8GLU4_9CYAN|nr:hypothetical protein [Scytonema hofmannii]MBD2604025.1 hypothetical protein [Scytonema hofmannii FACHB-248]
MIQFLTTPIFYLTPYIFLWSVLNGLIVVGLLKLLKIKTAKRTQIATAITTAVAFILWNWSIEFNRSTIHLNVDHPYLRISWADALNGICVFALTALVLSMFTDKEAPAQFITKIASVAALLTIFTDTFFF